MPLFSIVIPTFNASQTLRRCIVSIIEQTDPDFEIIIQDGQSTDATCDIAHSINDNRIQLFSTPDTGIYDAMNKAAELVSGDWILFLGSDDYLFESTVLATIRNIIMLSPSTDLIYGDVKVMGDTPWAKDGAIYKGEIDLLDLLTHNYSHQAIFYHRKIFDGGHRYNLKYRICADYDFNLFCTANYRVQYAPVVVSNFVSGGLSSVEHDTSFGQDKWMNIIRYFGSRLKDKPFAIFRKDMKRAAKDFIKRFDLYRAALAFSLYIAHALRERNTTD